MLFRSLWILAPGVGAQGGDLEAALHVGLRSDGLGMLIPVSRGISRAEDPRQAALDLRDAICSVNRKQYTVNGIQYTDHSSLADGLLEAGCIKFGSFTLKSGLESPIYLDLRRLIGYPRLLAQVAEAYVSILDQLDFDHLAPLPYAAMPIGTAISLQAGWPMIYPRKEVKQYGTKARIEGIFQAGERAVIIDDLITTGGSKLEGIEKLTSAGLEVSDVIVLIDRGAPGDNELAQRGYKLHSVLTLPQLLEYYQRSGKVNPEQVADVKTFLSQ